MVRLRTLASLFLLTGALAWVGCGGNAALSPSPASTPVLAQYDGGAITLNDFEERYARSAGSRAAAAADSMAAYEDFLGRLLDYRLKVTEARRLGLADDPEIRAEITAYRDQLALPFLLEREVLDGIIRDLYEKQREEVAASHILLMVDRDAPAADTLAAYERLTVIRDSLVAGQLGFAEAALRHSEDPSRLRNQGDLGYFSGGRMILAFEEAAYATPVGEISPVFRSPFGYHILHVRDRRPASPEIRASHILLRLDRNATPADSAQTRAQAEELRRRAAAGEDFSALAREYSQDPGSAPNGGDLGLFGPDRMIAPFAEAAFALENVGDLSDVVETQYGYHLILLTERPPFPTFEEKYDELKRLAERLPRTTERRQEVGQAYREEVGGMVHRDRLEAVLASVPDDSLFVVLRSQELAAQHGTVLATLGDSTVTLGDFAAFMQQSRIQPERDPRAQLERTLDQFLNERALALATSNLEARNDEFRRVMQEYADGVLLFRLAEDSVWSAASRDTTGLRTHFEAHRDRYVYPERRRVVTFSSRSDSLLTAIGRGLDAGLSPEAARVEGQRTYGGSAALRVDTLYLANASDSAFDAALTLQPGQRTEPQRYRTERILLYVSAVEPPRPMTFQEARSQVLTDYQDVLEARLTARLRTQYNARLFPERLGAAFADAPAAPTASR